jgi:hypothetical protein
MPDFDVSKLSGPDRDAYFDRLERDGPKDVGAIFDVVVRAAVMLRDQGKTPTETAATIMCDYYDDETLMLVAPVFRHQSIILLEAMVRQAIELGAQ